MLYAQQVSTMQLKVKKLGNSHGLLIPAADMRRLELHVGDELETRVEGGKLIIELPKRQKKRYKLADMIAQCDIEAPRTPSVDDWDNMEPQGDELL